MDIQNSSDKANLEQYTPNGEWHLLERVKLIRHIKHYPNVPNVPFPEIIVTFKLRRKTLYYMWVKFGIFILIIHLKFCMVMMVVLLTSTPWVLIMTVSPRQEVWNPLSLGVLPIQIDSSPLPPSPEPPTIPMRWAFHSTQCQCYTLALPQEKVTQFQSQNTARGWVISVS